MDFILLVGLVALYAAHRGAVRRLREVERQVDELLQARDQAEPGPRRPTIIAPTPSETPVVSQAVAPAAPTPRPGAEPEQPHRGWLGEEESVRETPVRETLASLFERFVGGRLLIWIGGIALAVAGVFLVRYSIEIGLVTPAVRMIMAALFGLALIAAGEVARVRGGIAPDVRVEQALVGAGILVLYAAAYGAHVLDGLIGLGTASALMALVTAAALALSLRHGAATAMLGLIGGFLTPLLVGDPDAGAVPLLAYLGLLNAALFALAQRRGWTWLAAAAVLLSFVWTGALLIADTPDALAAGIFVVALSLGASLAAPGEGRQLRLIQPAAIGLVQLALLVARVDVGPAAWALFGILVLGSLFLSVRAPEYRLLPPLALALALVLLAVKSVMGPDPILVFVAAAVTVIFAAFSWPRASSEDRLIWIATACAAFAGPVLILRGGEPELLTHAGWGLLMILLALGPLAIAWRQRGDPKDEELLDLPVVVAAAAGALLLANGVHDLVPPRLVPAGWLALALGFALSAPRLSSAAVALVATGLALVAAVWALPMVGSLWQTILLSLAGEPALALRLPPASDALLLLGLPALLLLGVAYVLPRNRAGGNGVLAAAGGVFLTASAYVLFKQLFGLSSTADFMERGFAERTIITQALFAAGWLLASGKLRPRGLDDAAELAGSVLTAFAAARFFWFDVMVHNPGLTTQLVGPVPFANLLLPSFYGAAAWLYLARRRATKPSLVWLTLSLAALTTGTLLIVRQLFQGSILTGPDLPLGEFYGYSLAGLLLSLALLMGGIKLPDKALRLAGLLLLTATILKVFLVDAAALEGVLRILSFLGLGVALIGIGKLYTKVLSAESGSGAGSERRPADQPSGGS